MIEEDALRFFRVMEEQAKKRNVPIETLFAEIERTALIINKKLPRNGRLAYAEGHFQRGEIGPDQVELTIRKNTLLRREMNELAPQIKRELEKLFGFKFPNYRIRFSSKLNPKNIDKGTEFTDWLHREIGLPTRGTLFIPIYIVHAYGHAYQMENGSLFRHLKEIWRSGNKQFYDEERNKAEMLIEGWATFVGKQYARERDEQLGIGKLYEHFVEESLAMDRLLDAMNKTRFKRKYYVGEELFSHLAASSGISVAVYAANTFTTDAQFESFVQQKGKYGKR